MFQKDFSALSSYQKISIWLSSLCLIHCLVTPFIIILLPSISSFVDGWVEKALIAAVVPISLIAFLPIWWKHKNWYRFIELITGISLVLIAQWFTSGHGHHEPASLEAIFEIIFMISGTGLIAYATFRNRRHTHHCHNPNHVHE
jgi:ABC-type microcin C transport system permease subunit YejB